MVYRRILEWLNRPDPNDPLRLAGMGMRCTFSELLADPEDFNVANGFFSLICGIHAGEFNADFYRPVERPIMLTWHAKGIIGNGGFAYLFEGEWPGDLDYQLTIDAHRAIGCDDQVRALEWAISEVSAAADRTKRRDAFVALPSATQNEINSLYWNEGMERKISKYIRENKKLLEHLRGRIS